MNSMGKALLVIVAMVFGGYITHVFASETPPENPDSREDCIVDERSECVGRCQTEHNCCIKSCNWVKPRKKSDCLKRCKSIANQCYQACDKVSGVEGDKEPPKADSRSESDG